MYCPLPSVCKPCLFTFAAGLSPGLTGQTYKQGIFPPFCVHWPEHARPRQGLGGSAGLLLVCPCIEDFPFCVPPGHSACSYRLCWHPHLPNCSQSLQLSFLQTNAFISISSSRSQAYSSSVKTFYAWGGAESLCLDGIPSSEVAVRTMENSCHYSL